MEQRHTVTAEGSSAGGRRVLLVDPDVNFGLLFRSYLESRGWQATWVADGREAIRDWATHQPDLVVTELQGESLDGFEFVERLHGMVPELPVVVCTRLAGVQEWSDEVFAALGVRAVLVRPMRFHQAVWVLEQLFE